MNIIGIDPGLTGAVAVLNEEGEVEDILDTPSFLMTGKRREHDPRGMWRILNNVMIGAKHAFIEQQQMRPHIAVQATAKVWFGYGLWTMGLVGLGFPHTPVGAQTWQKEMYQGVSGEGKERSLLVASRLWPNVVIPKDRHDRADALLIAEYGRRVLAGKVKHWEELR